MLRVCQRDRRHVFRRQHAETATRAGALAEFSDAVGAGRREASGPRPFDIFPRVTYNLTVQCRYTSIHDLLLVMELEEGDKLMANLPLFETPKRIESRFSQDADLVVYHGDVNDFVATIPDKSISLIITSPPYNLGKDCENRVSIEAYLETQSQVIAQLYRILGDDGSICWQVGNFVQDGEVYPLDILYYAILIVSPLSVVREAQRSSAAL